MVRPPPVTRELLKHLNEVFPNKLPTNKLITDRGLGHLFGNQEVIEYLQTILDNQEENILDSHVQ